MAPIPTAPVLVYDRIAQNRRKTVLLVIVAVLSVVPFIWALSYGVTDFFVSHFNGSRHTRAALKQQQAAREKAFQQEMKALENGLDAGITEEQLQAREDQEERQFRAAVQRDLQEEKEVRFKIELVVATALTIVLGMVFWAIASSPTSKVLAMCDARPSGPIESEARRLLDNLSIGAGLPPPKLFIIESSQPNAFAAGMDPEHSVVCVTRALLGLLDTRELEGVLAHELSHIGNRDTRLNTFVAAIALFLRLPYLLRRRARQESRFDWSPRRPRAYYYRILASPIYIYIFLIAPLMAAIIRAAISRSREFQADADAALLTRYPEGLMRALAKIRGSGSGVQTANPIVSHLYFADPTTNGRSSGLFGSDIFGSHPPIDERILRLAEFNPSIAAASIEEAIRAGQEYTKSRPATLEEANHTVIAQDELSVLTAGNPVGRVMRAVGLSEPIPVYDRGDVKLVKSMVVGHVRDGDMLVAFDDPGKMRQILTGSQVFGYIARDVKLERVDMLPQELGPHNYRPQPPAAEAEAPKPATPDAKGEAKEEYVPSYVRAAEAAAAAQSASAAAAKVEPAPATEYVPSYVRAAQAAQAAAAAAAAAAPVALPRPSPPKEEFVPSYVRAAEAARAAAALPPPPPMTIEPVPEPMAAFVAVEAPVAAVAAPAGISGKQMAIAAGLFLVVFAGLSVALFSFAGK